MIKAGEIAEARCDQRMIRPERLLADGKRLLQQRLGVRVALLVLVDPAEPGDRGGVFGIVLAVRLPRQGDVALGERRNRVLLALRHQLADLAIDVG